MTETTQIRIERLSTTSELTSLRNAWNALDGGVPFRSFEWLESWWRSYGIGPGKELLALAALNQQGQLVGLAPWYIEQSAAQRGVIRFLGSGEVCSDYLTILCRPPMAWGASNPVIRRIPLLRAGSRTGALKLR